MTKLRLRAKVNFPATVTATGGLAVSKAAGVWTVEPAWDELTLITTIDTPETRELWVRDPATDVYYRMSVDALLDALPQGPPGPVAGIRQAYSSTTTDADPGAGTFRLNNATPASATAAYLDNTDANGVTVSGIIDLWDDSTSTVKGYLHIEKVGNSAIFAQFKVTGSVVDGTGYRKLTLSAGVASGAFTNADTFTLAFFPSGDAGTIGGSTGATDNRVLRSDGTGGATLQNSAVTIDDAGAVTGATSLQINSVPVYTNVPQNSKSANYTTVLADAQRHILHPLADNNPRTFTIDSNANVAYQIGDVITFINEVNTVTIAITSDTLKMAGSGSTGSRTLAASGMATAIKTASTTWWISGTGLS